ncbi:P-loop NTPase fold protein [Flavobacterium sp. HJSW_4]|uniref:P-loop NTPase fold protein n=1 Tax=Flavobacterium sp. HJSW_4 TaxID=3344660 RepID=UPI0035F27450
MESTKRVIRIYKVLRELNISLERAVDFLKGKGIIIEANPNAKISDEEFNILQSQFARDKGNLEASKTVGEQRRREKEALRLERERVIHDKKTLGLRSEIITKISNNAKGFFFLNYSEEKKSLPNYYSEYLKDINIRKELVKNIKKNSIIFGKSNISQGHDGAVLQIKAVGIVESISTNEIFDINWLIKDLEIQVVFINEDDFKDLLGIVNDNIVKYIISKLDNGQLEKLSDFLLNPNVEIQPEEIIAKPEITLLPGLISDADTGEDHLNIKEDVEAFARVITAKNFEPPLAIALLGKWGSGKSFFMHKLKENVQYLSGQNPRNVFCEGIAHVHFNAWSYMDANLWASIVTRIFEGLQEYITNDTKAKNFKKEIEKKLTQNLNFSKDEITSLEKQTKITRVQLFGLYRQKINAKKELKKKISTIKQNTLKKVLKNVNDKFKVRSSIENSLDNNETFIKSTDQLKQIIPEKYWVSPDELYKQVKSKDTFLKIFFESGKWLRNTIYLLIILAIIYFTPIFTFLISLLIEWHDFTFSAKFLTLMIIIGNFWKRAVDTYKKLQPLVASFWNIKTEYDDEKANALFKFNQKEKALKLEIKNSKEDIALLEQRIVAVKEIKEKLEFKLNNALSTEALYSFIEKRANSEDYKKHLGIVSIIRKDFEILSDLLTDHRKETEKNRESEEFKKMFERPLERIILYIDDLDRCPEDRVVEVLEAVNLLMAFPLFIVIVGVDPRWVKTALNKKYEIQFQENDPNGDRISPSNYLEKIFQVPFHLKDADDLNIKNMIENLAKKKVDVSVENLTDFEESKVEDSNKDESLLDNELTMRDDLTVLIRENNINISSGYYSSLQEHEINALEITTQEIKQIKSLTEIIGNNPRCIKRFINIYRIVKTHNDFNYKEETKENELLIVMFFLALSMGDYKELVHSFEFFLDRIIDKKAPLSTYLDSSYKHEVTSSQFEKKDELRKILLAQDNELLKQEASLSRKHYQFIKRFTFKSI